MQRSCEAVAAGYERRQTNRALEIRREVTGDVSPSSSAGADDISLTAIHAACSGVLCGYTLGLCFILHSVSLFRGDRAECLFHS